MRYRLLALCMFTTTACVTGSIASAFSINGSNGSALTAQEVASFNEPWAMAFLPDGSMLVTEKSGMLQHVTQDGSKREVGGVPEVAYGGQGGLGDIVPHPDFAQNSLVYFSYAETLDGGSTYGAVVARAVLNMSGTPRLTNVEKLWSQMPKTSGRGHYSHRIAFGPKGGAQEGKMFITSGDRQKQRPAQDFAQALGKLIRLNDDGTVPADNPFQEQGELARTFWSVGHRNPLGIDFDPQGRLWAHEMGPRHGDELNLIAAGANYGWPTVSNGDNYSGVPIPDHDTSDAFVKPKAYWVPAISPAGLVIYDGDVFSAWRGDAFIGGLSSRALVRVDIDGENATEAERFEWGSRVREVEQGPNGALWVLEDRSGGRLLKLTPAG
ncbi:MAG: PQQ-dependent sugar dehydrogenase [Ahrensia sp.]|nr:PQQ-dependent sugar dehydrogenase [Ahrensia sp.]